MKKEYKLGEDLFLLLGFICIVLSVIVKFFGVSFDVGLTSISAIHFFSAGWVSLLINIALNVQEIAKK